MEPITPEPPGVTRRFTNLAFSSHKCQAGSASTMEKMPRVGIKLLYLKPDLSNKFFLHGRHFTPQWTQKELIALPFERISALPHGSWFLS